MADNSHLHYETVTPLLKETLGILMSEESFAPSVWSEVQTWAFATATEKVASKMFSCQKSAGSLDLEISDWDPEPNKKIIY